MELASRFIPRCLLALSLKKTKASSHDPLHSKTLSDSWGSMTPDLQGPGNEAPCSSPAARAPRAFLKIKSYAITHSRQRGARKLFTGHRSF